MILSALREASFHILEAPLAWGGRGLDLVVNGIQANVLPEARGTA